MTLRTREASEELMKQFEQLRVGVRKGMMWWGRERLAESAYESAVAEMNKSQPESQPGAVAPGLRDEPEPEVQRSDPAEAGDHRQGAEQRGQQHDPHVRAQADHG